MRVTQGQPSCHRMGLNPGRPVTHLSVSPWLSGQAAADRGFAFAKFGISRYPRHEAQKGENLYAGPCRSAGDE